MCRHAGECEATIQVDATSLHRVVQLFDGRLVVSNYYGKEFIIGA
jgi:hypothetical protein